MNTLKFVFGHRGFGNLVRRTGQIVTRFGATPSRMGGRFERFMDVLDEHDVRPTFPITALPLGRNPRFAHRLLERGAELAVHAWSHIDLTTLDHAGQSLHMGRAIELFRRNDVTFSGFRAPYLHWNEDTMQVVEEYRYCYSSNQTIWFDVIDTSALTPAQSQGIERGIAFYNPTPAARMRALPFRKRGFVEIPVCLPDDEIPLDRMYIHDAGFLERMWGAILEQTWRRGELFTLQLHPERIDFFTDALRSVISDARSRTPGVWIATLAEIARWWVDRAGNRVDFSREGDGFRVVPRVCEGTVIFVQEKGECRAVEPGEFQVTGSRRPCVGVTPGSDRRAIQVLEDLGYIVEPSAHGDDVAVHVGKLEDAGVEAIDAVVQTIGDAGHPIVLFGVWPGGNRSALSITGDIDALTIWDFFQRFAGR